MVDDAKVNIIIKSWMRNVRTVHEPCVSAVHAMAPVTYILCPVLCQLNACPRCGCCLSVRLSAVSRMQNRARVWHNNENNMTWQNAINTMNFIISRPPYIPICASAAIARPTRLSSVRPHGMVHCGGIRLSWQHLRLIVCSARAKGSPISPGSEPIPSPLCRCWLIFYAYV